MAWPGMGNESGQMKIRHGVTWFIAAALLLAETPSSNPSAILQLTATTANVTGAPDPVRIEILRWSTDEERDRLMAAWSLKPSAARSTLDKGAGKSGRGAGKGRGPETAAANNLTPETSLARALNESTTVGYLWSSEMAGYALRYAGKIDSPDGSQRIILITQRRLGAVNQRWNNTFPGAANTNEFSVIEVRLNAKGEGEGKVSLTGKVAPDGPAKIVTLENYDAVPPVFRNVHVRAGEAPARKP
jgi:hypothetical protein